MHNERTIKNPDLITTRTGKMTYTVEQKNSYFSVQIE